MKTIVVLISILCNSLFVTAQTEKQKSINITVTVNNATNDKGIMLFGLHTQETFMKTDAIQKQHTLIKYGKASVTFTHVIPGKYGIIVLHDENNNHQMDFDINGMPKEAYGASNNIMNYEPPQFMDAQFYVTDKNLNLEIRL